MPSSFDQAVLHKIVPDLTLRLRRIAGQAQGIERMLLEGRDCDQIVNQVAALKAAVEQVGVSVVGCLMESAIREAMEQGADTRDAIDRAKQLLRRI
ncbi:MAG: metal-sensitive transcriptional regulator [Bacillota bacterium]|jgi:DNA-binding FrmR family transcriptional regulator